ncbi:MAG: hypothetical protein K0S58_493 [Nitrospira sp.]|jgi:hypothetical protein|nr:hypothetical protein [Nitrospira sp.]
MRYVALPVLLRFLSNACETVGTTGPLIIPLGLVHCQDKRTSAKAQHNSENTQKLSTNRGVPPPPVGQAGGLLSSHASPSTGGLVIRSR